MNAERYSPRPLEGSGLVRLVVRWPGTRRLNVNCCVRLRSQHEDDAECASCERADDDEEKFAHRIEHLLYQAQKSARTRPHARCKRDIF